MKFKAHIVSKTSILLIIIVISVINTGCKKHNIKWDLDNKYDLASLVKTLNCESLSGYQFTASGNSTPSSFYWEISPGYVGDGLHLVGTPSSLHGSISFPVTLNKQGFIRFWIYGAKQKPDYPYCEICFSGNYFNGNYFEKNIYQQDQEYGTQYGWVDWYYWWNLQTEILEPGSYTIEIHTFTNTTIDEIEIWELE